MTREELLEAAALDAYGLLEEYEANLFTRSLLNAPPAIRDEIIELQAALVIDESFLPDETPDPQLRQRVIDAVNHEIEVSTGDLAPLATIGPELTIADRRKNGWRIGFSSMAWRAATFMLTGAAVVLAYFGSVAQHQTNELTKYVMGIVTKEQVRDLIGPDYLDFVANPNGQSKVLRPVNDTYPGTAIVYFHEGLGDGFILGMGLPQSSGPYTVRVVNTDGTATDMGTFRSDGSLASLRLETIAVATLATLTWEVTNSEGIVVLRSA